MVKVYARSCESDGKNFYTVPKSLQAKVKAQIEEDGYKILEDGRVVKDIPILEEEDKELEVVREGDLFNDDSAEVIDADNNIKKDEDK